MYIKKEQPIRPFIVNNLTQAMLQTSLKKLLARCQSGALGSAKLLRRTQSETTIRGALNRRRSSEAHSIEGNI